VHRVRRSDEPRPAAARGDPVPVLHGGPARRRGARAHRKPAGEFGFERESTSGAGSHAPPAETGAAAVGTRSGGSSSQSFERSTPERSGTASVAKTSGAEPAGASARPQVSASSGGDFSGGFER
jgi:hypothetical protein